jgi:hypothetical protein
MFEKLRKNLASFIAPQKNAMNLPREFLKYGNQKTMGPDWTQVIMSDKDLYTGYGYAAITRRANKVAKTAIENVITQTDREEFDHPYLKLIRNSKLFSEYEFWRNISTYVDLEGVYYLMAVRAVEGERIGNIKEFKMLNPYNIRRVLSGDQLEVTGYIETRKGMIREIPKEMIIPIWELNPFDEDNPFAMTDAAKEAQFSLKTAGDYTRHALKHNINSPGIVTTDVILPEQDFKQFAERVKTHTKGEPIFGNGKGAITYENMQVELSKAALRDVNELNREALFAVAGTSKTMMGIEESGTTRETARLQRDLNTDDHIIPRIQLVLDALNRDYITHSPEFESNKAYLIVNSPMQTDHEADQKETEVKTAQFDLFKSLINRGYEAELAAKYVAGEIDLLALGEPTNEPIMPQVPQEPQVEEENQLQGSIQQQQGSLVNAIVNVEEQLAIKAMNKVAKNRFEDESDIIDKADKRDAINELELVLAAFFGITLNFRGQEVMRDRVGQFALGGTFKLDTQSKRYIKEIARKVSESHVDTVLDDILVSAREAALAGQSVPQIQRAIQQKYSGTIVRHRAKAIARTETNRAFTRAQYEADRQFINQNNLKTRAFKQWRTRSDNPCPYCLALASEAPVPFFETFRDLGDTVQADGKSLDVGFEALEAGNAHPNCQCEYELILRPETDNSYVQFMEKKYEEMDKRTKEAKELMDEIKQERLKLEEDRTKLDEDKKELDKNVDELNELLDEQD